MADLTIYRGATEYFPIDLVNRGGLSTPAFVQGDTFTAYVYSGQDQAILFAPTVTWFTLGGTQTGYDQGQVLLTITADQSATLEAGGTYLIHIWWPKQDAPVASLSLYVKPSAGTATQLITPYNSYQDMLLYADWVKMVQRKDTDQEGFYSQRVQARQWFDEIVINAWTGAGYFPFGSPGVSAYSWSGGWGGSTALPSQWLRDRLAENRLLVRPGVVRACAFKSISLVALSPIGGSNFLVHGQRYETKADREVLSITAELDTATPPSGIAGLAIPLGTARLVNM